MKLQSRCPIALVCLASAILGLLIPASQAAITASGDVSPADPSTWTTSTYAYIGNTAIGSVTVDGGSAVNPGSACLGASSGSTGTVTVDGVGSTWTDSGSLAVAGQGNGVLNISNGGLVTVAQNTSISGYDFSIPSKGPGGIGVINFNNGTLNTGWLEADFADLTGTGTINARGLVSDADIVFDASHGLQQTILLNSQPGQNIALNLDLSSNPSTNGPLGAGYSGSGSLRIADGLTVVSGGGDVGYLPGSTGVATVDGVGSTWSASGLDIAYAGNGTLNIINGATVHGGGALLAYEPGATGVINVDGAGSTCAINNDMTVGFWGNATINISHGATFSVTNGTYGSYIGEQSGSGAVNVDGVGSSFTTISPLCIGEFAAQGTLTITNGAMVRDSSAEVGFNNNLAGFGPLSAVTVSGAGSTWTNTGSLSIGCGCDATLEITNGATVSDSLGYIGFDGTAGGLTVGTVSVNGVGSTWTNSGSLIVGDFWPATLAISNGGAVSDGSAIIGDYATASAIISGVVSTWTSMGSLTIGSSGKATVMVTGGAVVSASSVSVNTGAVLALDAGGGSRLTVGGGSGQLTNSGTVYLLAGVGDAPGVYTPISAGTWSGSGAYQALGGQWNASQHTFSVAGAQTGVSGQPVAIDLSTVQRLLISDAPSGQTVGAAFQGSAASSSLTCTATLMASQTLSALQQMLGGGETVPTGWQFATSGAYIPGNPVYLSMSIGSGYSLSGMQVWHFDGTNWTYYTPIDLNYDGTYANFVATDLSGYAVVSFDHQTLHSGTLDISSVLGDVMAFGPAPTSPAVDLTFTGNATLRGGGTTVNANRSMVIISGVTATVDTEISGYSLTIAGAISGGGALSKINPGTLYLTGTNTYTGGTTVSAGTLQTRQVANSLTIAGGAKAVLTSSGGTNPHASVINGISNLSIAGSVGSSGVLDLTDNGLIITGATAADETTIAAYISGGQLMSSVVATVNASYPGAMKIAYDFASNIGLTFSGGVATWGGQTISQSAAGGDLLILPTLMGDLNLDGAVNVTDVASLAPNLGKSSGQSWANGDLNGDGAVNFIDVTMLAPNLGQSVAAMSPNFELASGAAVTGAPEPASLALLMLGGLWLLPRRRAQHVGI